MRKIKSNIFFILAALPLLTYVIALCKLGEIDFLTTATNAFGSYGEFFTPLITPLLTKFVPLADSAGVAVFAWLIGYYVTLLMVYLVFSLFTFLITLFMNKVDSMKGGK